MTGNELGQIRAISTWAANSTLPDAQKIAAILRTIDKVIAEVDRNRGKVIPEGFVLAAIPYAIEQIGNTYRIKDQALVAWIVAQAEKEPTPEHIEVNR